MDEWPWCSVGARRHAVASADQVATRAGDRIFAVGGNAVDAAIATNAAIAVTGPHLCGMGGDLFALVYADGEVHALNSSGRAGSGADADALRSAGHTTVPLRHEPQAVTVPGCIDGWIALHDRFGSLPLAELLAPAIDLADQGFAASPLLVGALGLLDDAGRRSLHELVTAATRTGAPVRRPGVARALRAIAAEGRAGFYGGEFGAGLLTVGAGLFTDADLAATSAEWVTPLSASAFGVELHTIGPNSQGYLTLGASMLADGLELPPVGDERWAHVLIECAKVAGFDRNAVLHEGADGSDLLDRIAARSGHLDRDRAAQLVAPSETGDTTYLCTAQTDGDGGPMGVSLIQSNAAGLGSWLVEPNTQINLHDRGLGFSLEPGHPAELAPGRRPPHTLAPALATRPGELVSVFGTMGGDAQPQILLQLAARMFAGGESTARAIAAPRWRLVGTSTGFDIWSRPGGPGVAVEGHAPATWDRLSSRGHRTERTPAFDSGFGHAHAINVDDGGLSAAVDPRTRVGAAIGR